MSFYKGNMPGEDYLKIGEILVNGKKWLIHSKDLGVWRNLKVFIDGKYEGNANYWIEFNSEKKFFMNRKYFISMMDNYHLFCSVCDFFEVDPLALISKRKEFLSGKRNEK